MMNCPKGIHPRIFERRKTVFKNRLEYSWLEDGEQVIADWVHHAEGKLPSPESYRKKSLPRLRKLLGKIDHNIELVSKPTWGYLGQRLCKMYKRHRGYVVKELSRRMVNNT